MLLKEHLRDAWGFKGFVVSDCGAIVDVNQGHKKTADIDALRRACAAGGHRSLVQYLDSGLQHAGRRGAQGLVTEDLVTQAAERLYTARFQLGLFDPPGSNRWIEIPFCRRGSEPIAKSRSRPPKRASFC